MIMKGHCLARSYVHIIQNVYYVTLSIGRLYVQCHSEDHSWQVHNLTWLNRIISLAHYHSRKSLSRVVLRFSEMSIWFWRSPLSVVSARSIFHDRFSISASSWAWNGQGKNKYRSQIMNWIHSSSKNAS